ncbi:MAG: glycosyltransferase family 4 protein [Anaerolineae bacterium]
MTTQPANNTPKRHCMVVQAFYPLAETRVQRQAEALAARGYEVDVICLRLPDEPPQEQDRGVQVHRLPVSQVEIDSKIGFILRILNYLHFLILATFKLVQLHRRRPFTTVQVHNLPDFLVFCALPLKLRGVPVILDLHDLMPEFYTTLTGKDMSHWLTRLVIWQEQLSCRFANHVITVTELWRRSLIERGLPAQKVSVVMNVPDDDIFHKPAGDDAPKDNGHFRLLYYGSQTYRYGVDLILKAADRLRNHIPELLVNFHGWGDYHDTLKELAEELDLGDHVRFNADFVPLADLPQMISAADVGIVPYRRNQFTDGILPTKLMEYAALGMPVVVARTPVIEDYFDETMVEFVAADNVDELAESILKLYRDRSRRETLAKNIHKFNEQYNWTRLSNDYVALIERLANA